MAEPKRKKSPPQPLREAQPAVSAAGLSLVFWAASALFIFSGATGLAYEVIWFKRFSQLWGNSALAAGAVVASFLLGLGAGAYWIGRRADRVRSPMLWYAISEAAIGALAIALPFEIGWLIPFCSFFYRASGGHLLALSLMRAAVTFVFLGPPCFLMGGTLPLFIRSFVTSTVERDRYTAWFYALNTLGAAAGCYLTGFHLLPSIGLVWTNLLAVAFDLAIAAAALMLGRVLVASHDQLPPAAAARVPAESVRSAAHNAPPRWLIGVAAALAGCAALILQMVWTRQLALILGGSTYAFTAMLFTFLVGIALGSFASALAFRSSTALSLGVALIALALAASTAAAQRLIPQVTFLIAIAGPLRASQTMNGVLSIMASAVLELLPALGMGALFPLFVALSGGGAADAGAVVGDVYAANTCGSIVGALATPLVIIPQFGAANALLLAVVLYAAIAIVLIAGRTPRDHMIRIAAVAAALALVWVAKYEPDPHVLDWGMYLYGYVDPATLADTEIPFFKEGPAANVLVAGYKGHLFLKINGKVDATDEGDMGTQLGLAYLPRFLRPSASDVLVIGLGSGTTPGASLLFPGTNVRCTEIEPAVLGASREFSKVNHSPDRSPRFSIVFDDARSYLQETGEKYDLIISEPSNPWIAGISSLFTREFYQSARHRLKPGGLLAQWLQLYNLSPGDYAMVVRTMAAVFPHFALLQTEDADTLLVASDTPIGPRKQDIDAAQALVNAVPEVKSDLERSSGTIDVFTVLFKTVMADEDALRRFIQADGSETVNSDLNLKLEFDAPRSLFTPQSSAQIITAIRGMTDPSQYATQFEAWGGSPEKAGVFDEVAKEFDAIGLRDSATKIVALGLAQDPHNPDLLADKLTMSQLNAATFDSALSTLLLVNDQYANTVGVKLFQAGQYQPATEVFRRIVAAHQQSPTGWGNLAISYARIGDRGKAEEAFQKAIALDPLNQNFRKMYAEFQSAAPPATSASP